jgi:hypothetical protein
MQFESSCQFAGYRTQNRVTQRLETLVENYTAVKAIFVYCSRDSIISWLGRYVIGNEDHAQTK